MDPLMLWLAGSVVLPDAYERALDYVTSSSGRVNLEDAVEAGTGLRVGRPFRQWLKDEQTWLDLIRQGEEARAAMIDRLVAQPGSKWRRRHRPVTRADAERLVDSTIASWVMSLDPSTAVAVADYRAEDRHEVLLGRLDARQDQEALLGRCPPNIRESLGRLLGSEGAALRVLDILGTPERRTSLDALSKAPPEWMVGAGAETLRALALGAQAHGYRKAAGVYFRMVADAGLEPPEHYSRAAFEFAAAGEDAKATLLIERARAVGGTVWPALIEAAIANDVEGILAAAGDFAAMPTFVVNLVATAHLLSGDDAAATDYWQQALEGEPGNAGLKLNLGRLALHRSRSPGSPTTALGVRDALGLVIDARDSRRSWGGNSAEAVMLACQVAIVLGDYDLVIRLGCEPPIGEASASEASTPEVQFAVCQAALASNRLELAEATAAITPGFHRALLMADLLSAQEGPPDEIAARYADAWQLAADEQDKVAVWVGAGNAGIYPVPGQEELNARVDTLPTLVEASALLTQGEGDRSIALLRTLPNDESAHRLLVSAYVRAGEIDKAIATLQDASTRFRNPDHQVRAVELLVDAQRLQEAGQVAQGCLASLHDGHPRGSFLQEVLVAAANEVQDWSGMEAHARAWIERSGLTSRRFWLLVRALWNQTKLDEAWALVDQHPHLECTDEGDAHLWISMHARFEVTASSLAGALELARRFSDSGAVRAAAVNMFLLKGDAVGDLPATEVAEWRQLIDKRAVSADPDDYFETISVPEDPAEFVEVMRPYLEAQSRRIEDAIRQVRDQGHPYGVLALAAGRHYLAALVHRAAGIMPVLAADSAGFEEEIRIASESLDEAVLCDLSTMVVLGYLAGQPISLLSVFSRVVTTPEARQDAAATAISFATPGSGTIGWDVRRDSITVTEADPSASEQLRSAADRVLATAQQMSTVQATRGLDGRPKTEDVAWIASIEAAAEAVLPLWVDDVGLRAVARSAGIATFGTVALLEALRRRGRLDPDGFAACVIALRDEWCVDLPLDPAWVQADAEADGYALGPSSLAFSRPAGWREDLVGLFELWKEIVAAASQANPATIPGWIHAAANGLVRAVRAPASSRLLSALLAVPIDTFARTPQLLVEALEAIRIATDNVVAGDPVPDLLQELHQAFVAASGPGQGTQDFARVTAAIEGPDRETVRNLIFGLDR